MKSAGEIVNERLHATRRWIFRWKGLDGTSFRGFLALIITGGIFFLFAATVRLRVSAPQQWVERKASILQLPADGAGLIWALRAQEGGPYPARFDVGKWENEAGFSGALIGATRLSPGRYEPRLRALPSGGGVLAIPLSDEDERVFPRRRAEAGPLAPPVKSMPVPVLYPRSGITVEELPATLPSFDPARMEDVLQMSAPRDFLVELDREGRVRSCTDLSGNSESPVIRNWLQRIDFGPEVAKKSPTLAVAVGFTNKPAPDGPDPR